MTTKTQSIQLTLITTALAFVAVACGPSTEYTAPARFVNLEDDQLHGDVGQKSVSPEGAVVLLRERDNEPEGDLAFWAEALMRELTEGRGYELLEDQAISAGPGFEGKVFKLKGAYGGTTYRYDVAVFVHDDIIVTVESATTEETYPDYESAFDSARRSLREK